MDNVMMVQQGMIAWQGRICLAFIIIKSKGLFFLCWIFVGHDLSFRDICQIRCYLLCSFVVKNVSTLDSCIQYPIMDMWLVLSLLMYSGHTRGSTTKETSIDGIIMSCLIQEWNKTYHNNDLSVSCLLSCFSFKKRFHLSIINRKKVYIY